MDVSEKARDGPLRRSPVASCLHSGVKLNLAFDASQYTTSGTCRSIALSGRRIMTFFDDHVRAEAT